MKSYYTSAYKIYIINTLLVRHKSLVTFIIYTKILKIYIYKNIYVHWRINNTLRPTRSTVPHTLSLPIKVSKPLYRTSRRFVNQVSK